MARSAHPWYWEDRNCWAVIIGGQRHVLGEHPEDVPPPRKKKNKWIVPKVIQDRFDDLKVSLRQPVPVTLAVPAKPVVTVGEVFEKFLDWCQVNRSARTYEWSRDHTFSPGLHGMKRLPSSAPARASSKLSDGRPFIG